jgi:uncharacterized protein (UPF0335 family)
MSQRDSSSLPASRASSRSPPRIPSAITGTGSAPILAKPRAQGDPAYNPVRDTSGTSFRHVTEPASRHHRSLGFSAILNPGPSTESSVAPPYTRTQDLEPRLSPPGHARTQSGPSQLHNLQVEHGRSLHHPRLPPSVVTPTASPRMGNSRLAVPSLDRGSPTTISPRPALSSRAGMSPRPSRAHSLHDASLRGSTGLQTSPPMPSLIGMKRRHEGDAKPITPGPVTPRAGNTDMAPPQPRPAILPSNTGAPIATPTRSFSQPLATQQPNPYQYGTASQHHTAAGAQPWGWPQQSPPSQPQRAWDQHGAAPQSTSYGLAPLPAARESESAGPVGTTPTRGAARLGRGRGGAKASRSMSATVSHVQTGPNDPLFIVEIDTTTGSKEQDEKRQRNAEASARFRNRKKDEYRRGEHRANQLEEEKRALEAQLQSIQHACDSHKWQIDILKQALDFYRRDRNRLQNVVSRTPGIREAARGPPSPLLPAALATDLAQPPSQLQPQPPTSAPPPATSPATSSTHAALPTGYVSSDPLDHDRPARRRRVDQAPDMARIPYSQEPPELQAHEPLPSFASHLYPTETTRPTSTSPTEILPPLRSIESGRHETRAAQDYWSYHEGRSTYATGFAPVVKKEPDDDRGQR